MAVEKNPVFSQTPVAIAITKTTPSTGKFWKFLTNSCINSTKPFALIKFITFINFPVAGLVAEKPKSLLLQIMLLLSM